MVISRRITSHAFTHTNAHTDTPEILIRYGSYAAPLTAEASESFRNIKQGLDIPMMDSQ